MGGVKAGQVFNAGLIGNVIDGHNIKAGVVATLIQRPQHTAANAAITIQGNTVI